MSSERSSCRPVYFSSMGIAGLSSEDGTCISMKSLASAGSPKSDEEVGNSFLMMVEWVEVSRVFAEVTCRSP